MKKTRIVVIALTVLMVFALVGCEKDKSEEMAQTTVDFLDSFQASLELERYTSSLKNMNSDLSKENYVTSSEESNALTQIVNVLLEDMDIHKPIDETSLAIKSKKGSVIMNRESSEENGISVIKGNGELNNVEVEIEYKGTTKKISLSMKFSVKFEYKADSSTQEWKFDSFTLNGKTHKAVTYAIKDSTSDFIFTSATCDGKAVNLDILNAMFGFINEIQS